MKFNTVTALRETLERMETRQLDEMLLEELRKEAPNGDLIRLISSVLKERDKNEVPQIDDNIQKAWEQYQQKPRPVHKKPKPAHSFLLKAASVVLVLVALVALVPQRAEAMNFFERFIAWTEDVFSLINPIDAKEQARDYVFRTDNPGLQEVYDKVTELGITVPVVPSWIPEGYELTECRITENPTKTYLLATFTNGSDEMVYQMSILSDTTTHKFYKDGEEIRVEEKNGIKHTIMQNEELLVVVWTVDNIQCSIGIDCQEDVLVDILKSIYTMEVI